MSDTPITDSLIAELDSNHECRISFVWRRMVNHGRKMERVIGTAHGYLGRLFLSYAPQCEVLPDLLGLATQIDNLLSGNTKERDEYKQKLNAVRDKLESVTPNYSAMKMYVAISDALRVIEGGLG